MVTTSEWEEVSEKLKRDDYQHWLAIEKDIHRHQTDHKYPKFEEWAVSSAGHEWLRRKAESYRIYQEYLAWREQVAPLTIGELITAMYRGNEEDHELIWRVTPRLLSEIELFLDNYQMLEPYDTWWRCCWEASRLLCEIINQDDVNDPDKINSTLAARADGIVYRMGVISEHMLELDGLSPTTRARLEHIKKLGTEADEEEEAREVTKRNALNEREMI